MMITGFKNITKAITEAARTAFTEVQEQNSTDSFFAFVLSTNDDASYVSASVNSLENNKKLVEKNKLTIPSADEEYYHWSPCEWGRFEHIGDTYFKKVALLLRKKYKDLHKKQFEKYREGVFDSMINALGTLRTEGFWGNEKKRETIFLFITIYDSEYVEEIEDRSAKKLNSRANYQSFRNRYVETEKQQLHEQKSEQAIREALNVLPVEQQIQHWITQLIQWIEQPPEDEFQMITFFMENLQLIGQFAVIPMLDLVKSLMDHPNYRSQIVCFNILENIAKLGRCDGEIHYQLAQLLISYCKYNAGKERWQITPFHLAHCLNKLFDGYPRPNMAENNAIIDSVRFIEVAERCLNE